MEIYLIRHTAVALESSVCYGQSEIGLSNTFQEERMQIQNKLMHQDYCAIYSSPLKRCLQLANSIFPSAQLIIDERLMELNFGDWELKKWEEINRKELERWMNDFVNVRCTGGESYAELYQRSSAFLEECISRPHQRIIVVTHGGVIRSILSSILQLPLVKSFSLQIDYGKISKLKIVSKENIIVECINN